MKKLYATVLFDRFRPIPDQPVWEVLGYERTVARTSGTLATVRLNGPGGPIKHVYTDRLIIKPTR